jgi:hypothetical protein
MRGHGETSGDGLKAKTGRKGERVKRKRERVLSFLKCNQTNEFRHKFEFKHSKQCTSMYATLNSYD